LRICILQGAQRRQDGHLRLRRDPAGGGDGAAHHVDPRGGDYAGAAAVGADVGEPGAAAAAGGPVGGPRVLRRVGADGDGDLPAVPGQGGGAAAVGGGRALEPPVRRAGAGRLARRRLPVPEQRGVAAVAVADPQGVQHGAGGCCLA
jgi:hypothetical protein